MFVVLNFLLVFGGGGLGSGDNDIFLFCEGDDD